MSEAAPELREDAHTGLAIALVLLAFLLFSFVDTTTKWLIGAGLTIFQLAFMRYAVHFAITLGETAVRQAPARHPPGRIVALLVLRAFCLVSSTVVNFVALAELPLAVTSTILFTSPVIVCILGRILLNETLTCTRVFAVLLGLAGVMVVLNPFAETINWYAVLMLYPATGTASYIVLTRMLADQVPVRTMQFSVGALGTMVLLPFALWNWAWPEQIWDWVLLLSIGVFAWAGHEVLSRAHAFADASFLAPFGYSFILYLTVLGWLIFGDVPTARMVLGSVLIFLSAGVLRRGS